MKIIRTMIKYGTVASLALVTTAVFAASPEYTYVEASYVNIDIDGIDDGDGFGIGGSAEVGENIFIFADYATVGFSFGVDFDTVQAGIGYKSAISDTADVNFSIAYVNAEVDAGFLGSFDDDGYGLDLSLRSMLSNEFELNGGVSYVDFGGSGGDDTAIHGGAVYSFSNNFAVTGDISVGSDITTFSIGARLYVQ